MGKLKTVKDETNNEKCENVSVKVLVECSGVGETGGRCSEHTAVVKLG